ncbi:MAG: chromosome partitioning protein ParA, partial [Mangrovicoccus sp.]
MRDYQDLQNMNARSLAQQSAVRKATFSPAETKLLRRFSIWEISTFMFDVAADTLRKKLAEDLSLP